MDIDDRRNLGLLTVDADRELLRAIVKNDLYGVSTWLARGANVNARDADGRTPLFHAVTPPWRDLAIAELLLVRGAEVRMRDRHNQTPLHGAAYFGSEAHLAILLDRGAQINAPDGDGWTPLHCAAAAGRVPETTFLVSRGADVSRRDHKGQTPLNHALANHHLDAPGDDRRRQLELLLGGFLAVKVVAAKPDWLGISVEEVHVSYLEAERQAKHEGTLTIPAKLFPKVPEAGDCLIYRKGLSPVLDEAWRREWQRRGWWEESRRRDLGIEPER